jgi:hypothetical protein
MFNDYSQLLIDVQKKSNIAISSVRDLKFLKEVIETNTAQKIGFNTLRRLFGFLETKKPNINTLNTLAIYLGFRSFSNYKNSQLNYDEWYFQQNLQRLLYLKDLNKEELHLINTGLSNHHNLIYLAYFLTYYIEKNKIKLLKSVFNTIDFNNFSGTDLHKFSMIISSCLNRLSEKKSFTIFENLIDIAAFRNAIPLLYIDYNNLNSRYYKILGFVEKLAENSSDLFFVSLMKYYKNFYSENHTSYIEIRKPKDFEDFYIVLQGRYYGVCILNEELKDELKIEIIEKCKQSNVSNFAIEIIPALIIKEEYDFLEELLSLFYEELLENYVWSSTTNNSIYLIALANVNFKNNKTKIAKSSLEIIELEKVELSYESYVKLFYYLTKLKLSFKEKDKLENKRTYKIIKELVKKYGYIKFSTEAKKYYIR